MSRLLPTFALLLALAPVAIGVPVLAVTHASASSWTLRIRTR